MHRIMLGSLASLTLLSFTNAPMEARPANRSLVQVVSPHRHLHHALWELRLAHAELKGSTLDFGVHREKALMAMYHATKRIELMLAAVNDNAAGTPTKRDLNAEYKKYASHPHLHFVVHELRHAHKQLKASRLDYGGHREAGLREIHHAIHEVEALLRYAKFIQ